MAIGLNEELNLLDFWVAGFSQKRQYSHKLIWEAYNSGLLNSPPVMVALLPELENPYDPYAIGIWINPRPGIINETAKLGYVPRKVSKALTLSIDQVISAHITESRSNVYGKYYNCLIRLQVGEQPKDKNSPEESRFLQILLENIVPSTPTL